MNPERQGPCLESRLEARTTGWGGDPVLAVFDKSYQVFSLGSHVLCLLAYDEEH